MHHSRLWLAAYLGSSLSYLFMVIGWPEATLAWHKAIPVSILALWVIRVTATPYRAIIAMACIASLSGDFILALDASWAFTAGLGCFLLAHVAYTSAFWCLAKHHPWPKLCLLVVIYWGMCLIYLVPSADNLALPVGVYATVISLMVCVAFKTQDRRIIAGACLFALSDSLIAYDRFLHSFELAEFMIMTTYYIAQLLLILTFVSHYRKPHSPTP